MGADTLAWVWVVVDVFGRRPEETTQGHRYRVPPRLDEALHNLLPQLEMIIAYDQLQGCLVALNGQNIQALDPHTELHEGDRLMLVPPIAGG